MCSAGVMNAKDCQHHVPPSITKGRRRREHQRWPARPRTMTRRCRISCSSYSFTASFSSRYYNENLHFYSSTSTSNLIPPTIEDVYQLWKCMDQRNGSVLTSPPFSRLMMKEGDDEDMKGEKDSNIEQNLQKYLQDWTKNERWSRQWYKQLDEDDQHHHQHEDEDDGGKVVAVNAVVVRPKSSIEVAKILKYCSAKSIGVVPQGGNTGLVGGSVPTSSSEIVLSLECMNQIIMNDQLEGDSRHTNDIDSNMVLRAEAGCILQELQEFAAQHMKALVPVDLGAKGTCQIGGNLSTNAGGVYYYRYGSLHSTVIGIEVVIPPPSNIFLSDDEKRNPEDDDDDDDDSKYYDDQIMQLGYHPTTAHLKDNTGYDLKHLFIGAEGTLGVITKVALACPPLPSSIQAVWLTVQSMGDVLKILHSAQNQYLNEILAAFEFMDDAVLKLVQQTHASVAKPSILGTSSSYCVLIETHGSNEDHDQDKLQQFLSYIMGQGWVVDGVMAQNRSQVHDFWQIREVCNPAAAATGCVYKYDVSLSVTDFDDFIQNIKRRLVDYYNPNRQHVVELLCVNWGHIIDGNLHCNVVTPGTFEEDPHVLDYIEHSVFKAVLARNGSISAEHGLGQYKNNKLPQIKDPATLRSMFAIKDVFDPKGILNPGKYLPTSK